MFADVQVHAQRTKARSMAKAIGGATTRAKRHDRVPWPELGFQVFDRNRSAIFPLYAVAVTDGGDSVDEQRLSAVAEMLGRDWGDEFGDADPVLSTVDTSETYGRLLAESGTLVSAPGWWRIGVFALVFARVIDHARTVETLSLHVVPLEWVWDASEGAVHPKPTIFNAPLRRRVAAADASWEWLAVSDGDSTVFG